MQAEQAERAGDYGKVAELRYGKIQEAEAKLEESKRQLHELQGDSAMIKEEVDSEDIADVVSRWTGIPVSKMLESERAKLLRLEDELHDRVIGQDEAISAIAMPCAEVALGCRTRKSLSVVSFSWEPQAWAKPNWPRPLPSISLTAIRP
jgi:ATP-dependent Clp protease ATP-binding subunit ClpA